MTVDGWLQLLDTEEALPTAYYPYPYFSPERVELWGVFRDWLLDQGEDVLVALVDVVRLPKNRGGRFRGVEGFLRPHCTSLGKWYFEGELDGWENEWASRLPEEMGYHYAATLLETWRWLFNRVREDPQQSLPLLQQALDRYGKKVPA